MTAEEWQVSTDPAAMLTHLLGEVRVVNQWSPLPSAPGVGYVDRKISDRKLRLFACACARQPVAFWVNRAESDRIVLDTAERMADDPRLFADPDDYEVYAKHAYCVGLTVLIESNGEHAAKQWVGFANTDAGEKARHAAILRDLCNPFHRPSCGWQTIGTEQVWRGDWQITATIVALATAAYTERAGRKCPACDGAKKLLNEGYDPMPRYRTCYDCKGTGQIDTGTLDPDRLLVLSDACEEAGAPPDGELVMHLRGWERCSTEGCKLGWQMSYVDRSAPIYQRRKGPPSALSQSGRKCPDCSRGWRPLRGPHFRGCAWLDCLLGKS